VKRREKTVTQIGKICGVLKVVAQSRLQVAQEKALAVTPFVWFYQFSIPCE
jgi:F0F1-type ATP synthase gamma subunit